MSLVLRSAVPEETATLTALALRSKAHWGYDEAFMAAAAAELTVTPELLDHGVSVVALRDGVLVGFYILLTDGDEPVLEHLFVEPSAMGEGVGAALWNHMMVHLQLRGFRSVTLVSDPNAVAFYAKQGAEPIGTVESKVSRNRILPQFRAWVGRSPTEG